MKVYRVEHKDSGLGPYQDQSGTEVTNDILDNHYYPKHPRAMIFNKDFVCGFESRELLAKWFKGYIRKLKQQGFEFATYEVSPQHVDKNQPGTQLIFNKKKAKKVSVEAGQSLYSVL